VRPLDWTADVPGAPPQRQLSALRALVLAHLAVQGFAWWARPLPTPASFAPLALVCVSAALAALSLLALLRHGRLACLAALPFAAWVVFRVFPFTPNHTFLAFLVLSLFAWLDPDREEDAGLLLRGLRWLTVIVFFYAGLQKALHGLYFRGEFLSWMIAQGVERWEAVFGWMIPDAELARLRSYPRFMLGAGPYRVEAPLFVLASNAVWLGELALSLLLLLRRTRELAALAAIALVFTIQLAPREFMFALFYTQMLLLFVRGDLNRRLLLLFLFGYWYQLAVLRGAPGASFLLKAGGTL
jgi:hypothetical protein